MQAAPAHDSPLQSIVTLGVAPAAVVHDGLSRRKVASLVMQVAPAHSSAPIVNTLLEALQTMMTLGVAPFAAMHDRLVKQQDGSLVPQVAPAHHSAPVSDTVFEALFAGGTAIDSDTRGRASCNGAQLPVQEHVASHGVQMAPATNSAPVINTLREALHQ